MFETVSVEEAIRQGRRMVNYPVGFIMFGTAGIGYVLALRNILPQWFIAVALLAGFLFGWLYWSFNITRWRLWAFDHVRNVHELEQKAVEAKLIWRTGSIWEKTEIRTAEDKRKWEELKKKFDRGDVYSEDLLVPAETVIYYARGAFVPKMIIMTFFVGIGIYLITKQKYLLGLALLVIFGRHLYGAYKESQNRDPQITINADGIDTATAGFNSWADVEDERVVTVTEGRSEITYLIFTSRYGEDKFQVDGLDITRSRLEVLLHTYRIRSNKVAN